MLVCILKINVSFQGPPHAWFIYMCSPDQEPSLVPEPDRPVTDVVRRQHIYDRPNQEKYGTGRTELATPPVPHPSPEVDGKDDLSRKVSVSPDNAEPRKEAKTKKEKLSVISRLMGRRYRSSSVDPPPELDLVGVSGGEGAGERKWKSKRSNRKYRKKSSSSSQSQDSTPSKGNLSEGEGEGAVSSTYENLREANLSKLSYSASCDDLLSSSMSGSYSSSLSSVPQPRLQQYEAPPLPAEPLYQNGAVADKDQVDGTSSPSNFYQNLNEAQQSVGTKGDAPMTHPQDTPTSSSVTSDLKNDATSSKLPLYSNVTLGTSDDQGGMAPSLTPPIPPPTTEPERETTYAIVDILSPNNKSRRNDHPKLVHHSSLSNITPSTAVDPGSQRGNDFLQFSNTSPSKRPLSEDGSNNVIYGRLDFAAMSALTKIRQEHEDANHFGSLLERHDVREEEMKRKVQKIKEPRDQHTPTELTYSGPGPKHQPQPRDVQKANS